MQVTGSLSGMTHVPMVKPSTLARRLRAEMGAQKLSRKRLAEMTGISRPSIGKKLDGEVPWTFNEVCQVVSAMNLDWNLLLAADPQVNPPKPTGPWVVEDEQTDSRGDGPTGPIHYKSVHGAASTELSQWVCRDSGWLGDWFTGPPATPDPHADDEFDVALQAVAVTAHPSMVR